MTSLQCGMNGIKLNVLRIMMAVQVRWSRMECCMPSGGLSSSTTSSIVVILVTETLKSYSAVAHADPQVPM